MDIDNYELTKVGNDIIITYEFCNEVKLGCESVKIKSFITDKGNDLEVYSEKDKKILILKDFDDISRLENNKRLVISNIDKLGNIVEAALVVSREFEKLPRNKFSAR